MMSIFVFSNCTFLFLLFDLNFISLCFLLFLISVFRHKI